MKGKVISILEAQIRNEQEKIKESEENIKECEEIISYIKNK